MAQHKAVLLYKEKFSSKKEAANREKQIKGWNREKKMELIRKQIAFVSEFVLNTFTSFSRSKKLNPIKAGSLHS